MTDLGFIDSVRFSQTTLEICFQKKEEILTEYFETYVFKGLYIIVLVESKPVNPDHIYNGVYSHSQNYYGQEAVEFCNKFLKSQRLQIQKAKHDLES